GAHEPVSDAPRLPPLSLRDGDDALSQAPGVARPLADDFHGPARLLHDEVERGLGNVPDHLAGAEPLASVRAPAPDARLADPVSAIGGFARRDHWFRGNLAPAERRLARRICRSPRHSRLVSQSLRGTPQCRSEEHTSELQSLTNLVC